MSITLEQIRNIKEGQFVVIDGIKHLCTMSVGYQYHPEMTFRFTNMLLPKKIRHGQSYEYYLHCENILESINKNELKFVLTEQVKTKEQLTLEL